MVASLSHHIASLFLLVTIPLAAAFISPIQFPRSIAKSSTLIMSTRFKYEASQDIASVYHQMEVVDKKTPITFGPIVFISSLFLGVPFLLTVLLPLTIVSAPIHFFAALLINGKLFSFSKATSNTIVDRSGDQSIIIAPRESRKYDVVLLGSTGFTGKLATAYLAKQYGACCFLHSWKRRNGKWAIAGRSKSKLESTLKSIAKDLGNDEVLKVDTIIVDTMDRSTLKALVDNTRAVITTAGPFVKYDITGEVQWNKSMMQQYESTAQRTGAKIVSLCGHDSIPWDLTVRSLSEKLHESCNDELVSVECLNEMKGDVSGGTLATVYESIDRGIWEFEWKSILPSSTLDVYKRLPDGCESTFSVSSDLPVTVSPCRNPATRFVNRWCGPFVMAAINMDVVGRSISLSKHGNPTVTYREAAVQESFMDAFSMWFGTVILGTLIINPITRPLVKRALPQPGQGPSETVRKEGYLCVTGYGVGAEGNVAESAMYFPHDGGYQSTARMLVESGLCLALNEDRHEMSQGGFYSPAGLMCAALLDRLVNSGTKFAIRSS
ncbi:predicted protein [Thalassiosira pseudonana CCMP1335]|uniref:Saccharopine dehydrogenase NADP binding domain-containing protein n=1 Tax=Thalassiosira pseudonana TaxID=35128 RepID=B8C5M3_THAPS|nr:predicted protein [Thalassiosira pseudonana CCMP1335]EED91145.1 predicted protein [Thalassiosira pseudonana CCMP1335]